MVVLVTGGRKYRNRKRIGKELYKRRKRIKLLIHGGYRGADLIADEYAKVLGIQTCACEANWVYYRFAAGPIRNAAQLQIAMAVAEYTHQKLIVLAFHANLKASKGTRNMINQAKKKKVRVKIFK